MSLKNIELYEKYNLIKKIQKTSTIFQNRLDEIANLDVDYLLVPINDTNLGVGFAALLTHMLQPRVVIPCHYGYTYPAVRSQGGHPAEFVTALAARNYKLPATDIVILSPGGRMVFA